ncbi:hypothetical protein BU23DRAFT_573333 [Bimuria novae-zelandiae CBS 107.79]|uniref:Uncharacterized protein n=1 Tax=Bimuria novae-zelandiae CBS 107.79 TaxID=1447943 RepID=A0A6A5UTK4_9PLEO|nr:hypothetical protein BU23DRAFT_573333 [Bimuria novae-zelandiae CBS 107.79]
MIENSDKSSLSEQDREIQELFDGLLHLAEPEEMSLREHLTEAEATTPSMLASLAVIYFQDRVADLRLDQTIIGDREAMHQEARSAGLVQEARDLLSNTQVSILIREEYHGQQLPRYVDMEAKFGDCVRQVELRLNRTQDEVRNLGPPCRRKLFYRRPREPTGNFVDDYMRMLREMSDLRQGLADLREDETALMEVLCEIDAEFSGAQFSPGSSPRSSSADKVFASSCPYCAAHLQRTFQSISSNYLFRTGGGEAFCTVKGERASCLLPGLWSIAFAFAM